MIAFDIVLSAVSAAAGFFLSRYLPKVEANAKAEAVKVEGTASADAKSIVAHLDSYVNKSENAIRREAKLLADELRSKLKL